MKRSEIDAQVALLDRAATASEARAYEILNEAFEDTESLSFGGQLRSAAQCLRDRDTFAGKSNMISLFASDETLGAESTTG